MNKVILMGRLTRDAEVRYSQGESTNAIARFSLAVDRRFRRNGDEQTADFISCIAFGKTAEFFGSAFTREMLWQRMQSLQKAKMPPLAIIMPMEGLQCLPQVELQEMDL